MKMKLSTAGLEHTDDLVRLRIQFLNEIRPSGGPEQDDALAIELKKYFSKHIAEGDFVGVLAIAEEQIVATGGICFHAYPPGFDAANETRAYIMNIFTLPEYRKHGLAAKIFAVLMEEAEKRGIGVVSLHATDMGRPLYERFGFEKVAGEMKKKLVYENT